MFSSDEIIDLAIQIEKNALRVYRKALNTTEDPDLTLLINWLIEDENRHVEWFTALREFVKKTAVDDPKIFEIGRAILRDTVADARFSLAGADFDKMSETNELLGLAADFEKDKAQFFTLLRPFVVDAETLTDLDVIIAEEQRHADHLMHFIATNRVADLF